MLHDVEPSYSRQEHAAGWTEERVELAKKLWGEGKSASQIAGILGGGLTRNGVIGKLNRLKMPTRAKTAAKASAAVSKEKRDGRKDQPKAAAIRHRAEMERIKPVRVLPVPKGLPEPHKRMKLVDVGAMDCKWCTGDPLTADHSFCGKPVKPGSSWCPEHYARVFTR